MFGAGHGTRSRAVRLLAATAVTCLTLTLVELAGAGPTAAAVTTVGKDLLRSGWYPDQANLSPALVAGGTFGQQFSTAVDGQVYAQPLVSNNTLLVATETNNVYGLDPATGAQRWTRNLGVPWNPADVRCADLTPSIGITGTPVVDESSNTMYLLKKSYAAGTSGPALWYAHALDVTTGAERPNFPVLIQGTASNAPGQNFNATTELQRPGLLLMDGVVYAAFGGHCDAYPYDGWVVGISTAGKLTTLWSAESKADGGAGIWQSGGGLVSDGPGQILLATGNGNLDATAGPGRTPAKNLGQAVARLTVQADGSLKTTDYFVPYDATSLNAWDADLGSGAPMGLPAQFGTVAHPHLMVEVGKQGYLYLLDRDNLGGRGQGPSGGDAVLGRIGPDGGVWGKPAAWPGDGGYVYVTTASAGSTNYGTAGALHAYRYGLDGTGLPTLSLVGTSTDAFGLSSSPPVVTSDGTTSGSALVWVIYAPSGSGIGAQLRAYRPVPVNGTMQLVQSFPIGTSSKFNSPAVDDNHVYVGTRDGRVIGFGSPVKVAMSGASVSWGATTVGQSAVRTATLTANAPLTVTAISTSNTDFSAGVPSPGLPVALGTGRQITVPVTFSPKIVGPDSGALTVTTDIGTVSLSLNGTGQSPNAQISASPKAISFGGVAVGANATGSATFSNTGAQPLTVQSYQSPVAPFTVAGLPPVGVVVPAGQSFTVTATFAPTVVGTFTDVLAVKTSAGEVDVPMSGSSAQAAKLVISSDHVDLGTVPTGSAVSRTFTLTNTGGSPLTLNRSKPPVAGKGFTATSTLPEGTSIAAGATVSETVQFAPTGTGAASDVWAITGTDASGPHLVTFTGTGVGPRTVPDPATGGWTLNKPAQIVGNQLQLTAATDQFAAPSAFWPTAVGGSYLDVSFDATIDDAGGAPGGGGADGLTLTLADPKAGATPTSTGTSGSGLGWIGIPGVAIALDTFQNGSDPSDNFIGIASSAAQTGNQNIVWAATTTSVPPLRGTKRHVELKAALGQLSVFVDGTQVLTTPMTLPVGTLLGFTAGNGLIGDRHVVSNVSVHGVDPVLAPANLVVSPAAIGFSKVPAGSVATSTFTVTNSGGSPLTITGSNPPVGGKGLSATTVLPVGTVIAAGQSVPETVRFAPTALGAAADQWTITSSAGAGTVALSGTGVGSVTLPALTDPGWTVNGSATRVAAGMQLTDATTPYSGGSTFFSTPVDTSYLNVSFDSTIDGGTGADGLTLGIADAAVATPTSVGAGGSGLGWSGIAGTAVALDTLQNGTDPSNNFIGVTSGSDPRQPGNLVWNATSTAVPALRGTVRHVQVQVVSGRMTVSVDGTAVLDAAVALPAKALIGFTGGDGQITDRHLVGNVVVTTAAAATPPPPPPPPAAIPVNVSVRDVVVVRPSTGTATASFPVVLSAPPTAPVTVTYRTLDGAAKAGVDYRTQPVSSVTFAPGQTLKSIPVTVLGRGVHGTAVADFHLRVLSVTGGVVADGDGVTRIIDPLGPLSLWVGDVVVQQGATATTARFRLSLSAPVAAGETVTVKVATANGSAVSPTDYTALPPRTVTFPVGSSSVVIGVPVSAGVPKIANRTFTLRLSSPSANVALGRTSGTATLRRAGSPVVPLDVSVRDAVLVRPSTGAATASFAVVLSAASAGPVTVRYQTVDGAARAGVDYRSLPVSSVTFAAGQTRKSIPVTVLGRGVHGTAVADFHLRVLSVTGGVVADGDGVTRIIDPLGPLSIWVGDLTMQRTASATTAQLRVSLSAAVAAGETVTVRVATADGSAVSPTDYTALPPTTVTFPAGSSSSVISIPVRPLVGVTPDRVFSLGVSGPSANAVLGRAAGVVTLRGGG